MPDESLNDPAGVARTFASMSDSRPAIDGRFKSSQMIDGSYTSLGHVFASLGLIGLFDRGTTFLSSRACLTVKQPRKPSTVRRLWASHGVFSSAA
jgi:hypothetical protein